MAYGQIITQEQAEETLKLLSKWRERNASDFSNEDADLIYDTLRFVLQYDENSPAEFLAANGFDPEE